MSPVRAGLHYVDEGAGETVLMVHGNPTSSFHFRALVAALKGERRCIAPDHRGMGKSDRPSDAEYAYTLRSRVDDLERLMEAVAPAGPVTLVLHDWGGMIGMGWAVRHPDRVKAIAAMNTSCFRLPGTRSFPAGLRFMRGAGGGLLRVSESFRRLVLRSCAVRPLPPEVAEGYLAPARGWAGSRAFQRFVQDIPLGPGDASWETVLDIERGLGRLKHVPMLLPWGMRDWVFDEHFLRGWQQRFPAARAVPFPDAGHFLLEDAGERVVPLIRDFALEPAAAR